MYVLCRDDKIYDMKFIEIIFRIFLGLLAASIGFGLVAAVFGVLLYIVTGIISESFLGYTIDSTILYNLSAFILLVTSGGAGLFVGYLAFNFKKK